MPYTVVRASDAAPQYTVVRADQGAGGGFLSDAGDVVRRVVFADPKTMDKDVPTAAREGWKPENIGSEIGSQFMGSARDMRTLAPGGSSTGIAQGASKDRGTRAIDYASQLLQAFGGGQEGQGIADLLGMVTAPVQGTVTSTIGRPVEAASGLNRNLVGALLTGRAAGMAGDVAKTGLRVVRADKGAAAPPPPPPKAPAGGGAGFTAAQRAAMKAGATDIQMLDEHGNPLTPEGKVEPLPKSHALTVVRSGDVPAMRGAGGGKGPPAPPGDPSFHWPDRDDSYAGARASDVTEKDVFQMGRNLDDVLYRVQTNNDADKLEARQFIEKPDAKHGEARPWWRSPDFQERVYHEVEENLKDPHARIAMSDDVKEFVGSEVGHWYAEQGDLYKWIKDHPTGRALLGDDSLPDISGGYVHRIPKGKGSMYDAGDPEGYSRDVLTRGRNLSKQASALKGRKFFVLEGPDGQRAFATRHFVDSDAPYHGKTYTLRGKTYIAKYATTKEIEANTASRAKGYDRPVEYHKNFMVNTVENVLRLRRVKRAMMVTDALKRILEDRGLIYWGDAVHKAPGDFISTRLPQFVGARMHPAFAYSLDDFFGSLGPDTHDVDAIEKVNNFITRSIFFTPFPHLENVASFWAITRGANWVRPAGWKSLMRNMARATQDVVSQGPITKRLLREGAAMQYPRVANQNFHRLMIERMGGEIERDPQTWAGVAKQFGFRTPIDLVKMIYRTSQKYMWMGNDILMMQRILELQDQGLDISAAIKKAERDIPNYRIPSQLWRTRGSSGRAVSQFLQNPNYIMFGRYKYDQVKFITQLAHDLIHGRDAEMRALMAPTKAIKYEDGVPKVVDEKLTKEQAAKHASGSTRREALAKAVILTGIGTMGFALMDRAVQAVSGNKDARMRRPGPWAMMDDVEQWAAGAKDGVAALASFLSLSPAIDAVTEMMSGKDAFGRDILKPGSTPLGYAVQAGEYAAGKVAPLGEAMETLKPGGTAAVVGRNLPLGVQLPRPGSKQKAERAKRAAEKRGRKAEAQDPVENALKAAARSVMP